VSDRSVKSSSELVLPVAQVSEEKEAQALVMPPSKFAHQPFFPKVDEKTTPANGKVAPSLENDIYKIENLVEGRFNSFLLKPANNLQVVLNYDHDLADITGLAVQAEQAIQLYKKHYPDAEILTCKMDGLGHVNIQTKDENGKLHDYVATPKYVIEKDLDTAKGQEEKDKKLLDLEIQSNALEVFISGKVNKEGFLNYEELYKLDEDAQKEWESLDKKELEILLKVVEVRKTNPEYNVSDLPKEELNSLLALGEKKDELKNQQRNIQRYRNLIQEKETVENQDWSTYSGYMKDDLKITGRFTPGERFSVSLVDSNNESVLEGFQVMVYQNGVFVPTVNYQIRLEENEILSERYLGSDSTLFERTDPRSGIREVYEAGKLESAKVTDKTQFFKNIDSLKEHPKFRDLLLSVEEEWPTRMLEHIGAYRDKTYRNEIFEDLVSKQSLTMLNVLKNELNGDKLSNFCRNLEEKERESLQDLVNFRLKMLEDGRDLVRTLNLEGGKEYNESTSARIAAKIFDEDRSRGYLEVDDDFVDFNDPNISRALDTNNPKLSEKELKMLGARFVYDDGKEISRESVNSAISKIIALRDQTKDIQILKGRNVILLGHSESVADVRDRDQMMQYRDRTDTNKFITKSFQDAVEEGQGESRSPVVHRADLDEGITSLKAQEVIRRSEIDQDKKDALLTILASNPQMDLKAIISLLIDQSLRKEELDIIVNELRGGSAEISSKLSTVREQFISSMINTPPPLTLICSAHGSPDGVYLSDGILDEHGRPVESDSTVKISDQDFAKIFQLRAEKFKEELKKSPDIVILHACYNANLIRAIDVKLDTPIKPMFGGPSEYNQVSFSHSGSEYGNLFFPEVLGIKKGKVDDSGSTIGDAIKNQFYEDKEDSPLQEDLYNTNPGFYVPDENGKLRQISKLDSDSSSKA
jgi:hypothetical protein